MLLLFFSVSSEHAGIDANIQHLRQELVVVVLVGRAHQLSLSGVIRTATHSKEGVHLLHHTLVRVQVSGFLYQSELLSDHSGGCDCQLVKQSLESTSLCHVSQRPYADLAAWVVVGDPREVVVDQHGYAPYLDDLRQAE